MSFNDRQELSGGQESPLGVQPADESLGAENHPCTHVHLGLVVQHEFVGLQCLTDSFQAFMTIANTTVERWIEDVVAVPAFQLCLVHGLVVLAQQLIRIRFFRLREIGHARADRYLEGQVAYFHGLRRDSEETGEYPPTSFSIGNLRQDGNKFVSTQVRKRIVVPQGKLHATRYRYQNLVSDTTPMAVVDGLEFV